MKAYFQRLLSYDYAMTLQILDAMEASGAAGQPVKLMAHLLAAKQVWLKRCNNESSADITLWPSDQSLSELKAIAEHVHEGWQQFMDSLNDSDDFSRIISYKNFRGDSWSNRLDDVMAHLINHGTHHRAQIGLLLKNEGLEQLPVTDYIFYIREM